MSAVLIMDGEEPKHWNYKGEDAAIHFFQQLEDWSDYVAESSRAPMIPLTSEEIAAFHSETHCDICKERILEPDERGWSKNMQRVAGISIDT